MHKVKAFNLADYAKGILIYDNYMQYIESYSCEDVHHFCISKIFSKELRYSLMVQMVL